MISDSNSRSSMERFAAPVSYGRAITRSASTSRADMLRSTGGGQHVEPLGHTGAGFGRYSENLHTGAYPLYGSFRRGGIELDSLGQIHFRDDRNISRVENSRILQ